MARSLGKLTPLADFGVCFAQVRTLLDPLYPSADRPSVHHDWLKWALAWRRKYFRLADPSGTTLFTDFPRRSLLERESVDFDLFLEVSTRDRRTSSIHTF